jgi:hypothetical protein
LRGVTVHVIAEEATQTELDHLFTIGAERSRNGEAAQLTPLAARCC